MDRREFLGSTVAASVLRATQRDSADARSDREFWVDVMRRLADPVLTNLANRTLKARMPVEQAAGADRRGVTHLEALGRLIAGLAPWIELSEDDRPKDDCARTTGNWRRARLPAPSIPRRPTP